MGLELLEVARVSDLARRGNSALELVQRFVMTAASTEAHLEKQLQKALADVTAANDLITALTERTSQAEERADEAEKWLRRLHARLEEEFGSAKRVLAEAC